MTAGQAEIDRLALAAGEATDRAEVAADRLAERRGQVTEQEDSDVALVTAHEDAVAAHAAAARRVAELTEAERAAERDRASWQARRDALALGLTPPDGAAAVLGADLRGVLGPLADQLTVRAGDEVAVAAALGGMADAVVVAGVAEAAAALAHLKDSDGGRAGLLVTGGLPPVPRDGWPELPEGRRWALDVVEAPAALQPALARALERVALVPDLDAAVALVATHPRVRAVTAAGDLVGADWAAGGQANPPSNLEVRARVDDAEGRAVRGHRAGRRAGRRALRRTGRPPSACPPTSRSPSPPGRPRTADGPPWPPSSPRWGPRPARPRPRPSGTSPPGCAPRAPSSRPPWRLADLERRLADAEAAPVDEEPPTEERDRLRAEVAAARQAETEARLGVRTAEERARALHGRAESLRRQARQERAARERAAAARVARERGAAVAARVRTDAERALAALATSLGRAAAERDAIAAGRSSAEAELLDVRVRVRAASADLERLTDEVHRDEVARAEQRYRIEALEVRAAEEYGVDLPTLLAEYGPAALGAAVPAAGGRGRGHRRSGARLGALRPRRPGAAGRPGRARPRHAGQGQPAGAGGVRGAGGAARLPRDPARGPQEHPPRPAHRRPRGRRAHPRGVRRRVRRRAARVRGRLRDPLPRRAREAGAHRARRPAHHRRRGGGPAAGQEGQAALAALRRRALADRRRAAGGDLPRPALAVLRARRGRGGARRRQPRPAADAGRAAPVDVAADRHHAPEADDGDRRRALRREHARRRDHRRDQPAPPRARSRS